MDDFIIGKQQYKRLGDAVITEISEPDYWKERQPNYESHFLVEDRDGKAVACVFFEYETALMCCVAMNNGHNFEESAALAKGASRLMGLDTNY